MEIIKTTKDKERVKSILRMVELIEKRINKENKQVFSPLILSDYYEIVKELMTAVLLCDGFKTLSHKDLLTYIEKEYKEFNPGEISAIDKLRIIRNRVVYEGFQVSQNYLDNYESVFKETIKKLKLLIKDKLVD